MVPGINRRIPFYGTRELVSALRSGECPRGGSVKNVRCRCRHFRRVHATGLLTTGA
jgi:hypothetical protein